MDEMTEIDKLKRSIWVKQVKRELGFINYLIGIILDKMMFLYNIKAITKRGLEGTKNKYGKTRERTVD